MTTETKVEAVALWVPNGHTLRDGSWEDGPGDLVRIDEASDFQKRHGFPLVPASAITALEGEIECLRVQLAGSQERAMMVLRAKDDWMDRANKAERRVAELEAHITLGMIRNARKALTKESP